MRAWIIIAVIAAFILLVPIRLRVYFLWNDDGNRSELTLSYGFLKIKGVGKKKSVGGKVDRSNENSKRAERSYLKILPRFIKRNYREIKELFAVVLKRMLKRTVKVKKLYINSEIGLEDAMNTALVYGAAAGAVYNAAGLMDRQMRLEKHSIKLHPDFDVPHIFAELEAIISTTALNVILLAAAALKKALPLYKKLKEMIGEKNNGKSD